MRRAVEFSRIVTPIVAVVPEHAPMKEIQLREAKATLSAVIEAAENGEPTTITKHGRPAAVIVSHSQWTKLKTRVPSFDDLLLAVPRLDPDDLPKRRPARVVHKR